MNKKVIFSFVAAFFIILLSSAAFAFSIDAGSVSNICAGTTMVVTDIVKGSGTFTVNTAGTAKPFSTVVPTGFSIEDGAQYLYTYVTPNSKTTSGTYDLTIKVNSGTEEQEVTHSITVEDCHASDLTITPQILETCPCSPVVYTATLRNRGQYMESYLLSVEGTIKDRITLSDSVLNIDSNGNKTFTVYVNTSCNSGASDFTIKAKATTSTNINEIKATLDIKPCYEYSIYLPQNYYSICEHDSLNIPLTVFNEGTATNKIFLNFKGPLWSSLTKSMIELSPNTRVPVNVTLNPNFKETGNFTISIESMSDKGFVKKSVEAKINVDTCYGVALNILNDKDKLCNGISNTYDFTIKNDGKFENTYNLELKGPEWASIDSNTVTLDAGEEKTLSIKADPSNTATAGTFEISLKTVDPVSNVESKDSIELSTLTIEGCYKSAVESDTEIIDVAPDSFTTAVLNVQNLGLRSASYIVDISGVASKYAQLNPGIVTLEPGKAQSLYLYIAPPADTKEGIYDLTITTRLKDSTMLSSKKLSVNVSMAAIPVEVETESAEENVTKANFFVDLGQWFADAFNSIVKFVTGIFTIEAPQSNETVITNETEITNNTELAKQINQQFNQQVASNAEKTAASNETVVANETVTNDTVVNETQTPEVIGAIEVGNMTANETQAGPEINITITANETQVTENETLNITIETNVTEENATETTGNETASNFDLKNFLIENRAYIVGAIIVLFLVILFATGLWKKIINFFEEDEVAEKK